jgi:GT2 family glycosyltransferase
MQPLISILIPTQGRLPQLGRLLDGLAHMEDRECIQHEIIIANNAQDENTTKAIEAMVGTYSAREPNVWLHVRESVPGKSRALNAVIPLAKGKILGFLDDDVEVAPSWLRVTCRFFAEHSYDVKQGSILIPPAMQQDQRFLHLLNRYRTIYYYQKPGLEVRQIPRLNGANMALRRELLERTGLFDERIGPGASGSSMDVEFGERVLRAGGRIGYEPRSIVYHDVDWSRLTEDYFRRRHEMQGRSRLIYKENTLVSVLPNLLAAAFGWGLYSILRNERKRYRAKGRVYHYRAMLEELVRSRRKPFGAAVSSSSRAPSQTNPS